MARSELGCWLGWHGDMRPPDSAWRLVCAHFGDAMGRWGAGMPTTHNETVRQPLVIAGTLLSQTGASEIAFHVARLCNLERKINSLITLGETALGDNIHMW